ncbi:MAG: FAD-binding protein [Rhodospirillales bacterium]|nr:FAD-binding protein [Alphaproteobacteria bacterium]MBL6929485.1 FAD-binding protein [Rhodospirillales bacterium]
MKPSLARVGANIGDSALAERLRREIEGDVLFDAFTRGRYSTDASIYQIEPIGVVIPKTEQDVVRVIQIAGEQGVAVLPRGGGSSQNGQVIGEAIIIDTTRYLDQVIDFNPEDKTTVTVQPGIVLDALNGFLKPHGVHFAVDPSTASRATIGGMAGNNSSGARSIRYGLTADNVLAIDALLNDGAKLHFADLPPDLSSSDVPDRFRELLLPLQEMAVREADEIALRFPKVLRRVGGYNIDALVPGGSGTQLGNRAARLLVGSEGTLAFSTALKLMLHPVPTHKVMGVCHFPTFYQAMDMTRHIVGLGPAAVELIDSTMINLARDIALFRPIVERFVMGEPAAVLLVEFSGEDGCDLVTQLIRLKEMMADHGFPDAVVEATDPAFQSDITTVRKAGLNIMMSMKGAGKPISFIEDCAVPLDDLAEYTSRLTQVFESHGTTGTWYAHASVGCLHVRPVLNMKEEEDATKMRAIAEEAFAAVREYKGSHSGEHGDGISRSEFHGSMFGERMVANFETVKDTFDPDNRFNPNKIVRPYKMDDRSIMRFAPDYRPMDMETALDWSEWGGMSGAAEMCNNNGACRKFDADSMCPSFRVTRDEAHVTRGRVNTLRLALSGQLGADALHSDEMHETMKLCVSCKACKRECPLGIDMARMKIEYLYQRAKKHGISLGERLVAYMPRYAPWASRFAGLINLRNKIPLLARLGETATGLSHKRDLPEWRRDPFRPDTAAVGPADGSEIVLFGDTFNTYFEPENLGDAADVLVAAGYRVHFARPDDGGRPLCCGRTFLSAGLVDEAKAEARRLVEALKPFVARGVPIVGLEPSCLLTLRDEYQALLPGPETDALAKCAVTFEEFLEAEADVGRLNLTLETIASDKIMLHGHCHQKAFGLMGAIKKVLGLIPDLDVETIDTACCGMAGAFGYNAETYETSIKMAEAKLAPAVRKADPATVIAADGTSCRHQINDTTGRRPMHVARILKSALKNPVMKTKPED